MLQPTGNYDALRETFRWPRPATYNMAAAVSDEWAARDPERLAIRQVLENGSCRDWSHLALNRAANRLANALEGLGLNRGDRVALLLPQIPQTAIAHLAAYKTGAIAVPLAALFGLEALRYRLSDSGARVLVTDTAGLAKLAEIRSDLPGLDLLIRTSGERRISNFFLWELAYAELHFSPVLWPDFGEAELWTALRDYANRERRYGLTSAQLEGRVNGEPHGLHAVREGIDKLALDAG